MLLADAHRGLHVVAASRDQPGLEHLRREVLRIGGEVLHEALEVLSRGAGDEGGAAPVVQQRAGDFRAGGRREAAR